MTPANFVALGDVARVDSGPAFPSAMFGGPDEGIRLVRGDNIEPGALRWTRTKTWPVSALAGYEHLFVGADDLILGMDRPVISSGLKLARVRPTDLPALLVQRVARIRPVSIERDYLYHWLSSREFAGHLQGHATGTQLPHVTLKSIRQYPVPRFGAQDERSIVDLVEDHLSRLDAADAGLASSALRSKALLTSLGAELHKGPPVPLGDLAWASGYGTSEKCIAGGPGVPVVRIPNLVDGVIDLMDEKRVADPGADVSSSMLTAGDLLIIRTNGSVDLIGRSAVVQDGIDAAFASYLIRYRLREDLVRPAWAQAMLSTPQVRRAIEPLAASSAGQHNLSLAKLNPLELPVPSLEQQDAGLARLRELEARVASVRSGIDRGRKQSAALRRSLLAAAFSGRLPGTTASFPEAMEMISA
jgi:type I restriction enzyme S subunit